jgi:hypothetical protein
MLKQWREYESEWDLGWTDVAASTRTGPERELVLDQFMRPTTSFRESRFEFTLNLYVAGSEDLIEDCEGDPHKRRPQEHSRGLPEKDSHASKRFYHSWGWLCPPLAHRE